MVRGESSKTRRCPRWNNVTRSEISAFRGRQTNGTARRRLLPCLGLTPRSVFSNRGTCQEKKKTKKKKEEERRKRKRKKEEEDEEEEKEKEEQEREKEEKEEKGRGVIIIIKKT
jgi:hypothetical protein